MKLKNKLGLLVGATSVCLIASVVSSAWFPDMLRRCDNYYLSPSSYSNLQHPSCPVFVFLGYVGLPALALLLSLVPLFFTKEHAYIAWRKFAVWALPIMLVFIFTSPTSTSGGWGLNLDVDREMAALFSAVVFTIVSWLITARTALKH